MLGPQPFPFPFLYTDPTEVWGVLAWSPLPHQPFVTLHKLWPLGWLQAHSGVSAWGMRVGPQGSAGFAEGQGP